MPRSLSAIQPTGIVHIGNYIGAISQFVKLQHETEAFYFLVDYHAMTVPFEPRELHDHLLNATAIYLAAGLDPKKATIFQQSQVHEHTELGWILMCLTRMGEAERMTQFKDKGKNTSASVGLLSYPMLMAADILLYDTDYVPVGEDQKQHVELARDLAERFNKMFGETFAMPTPLIKKTGARIMGLDDPTTKMSKSAGSPKNYIALTDDEGTVRKKIAAAVTDSEGTIDFAPAKRPGVSNLVTIMAEITGMTPKEVVQSFDGKGYKEFKGTLADTLVEFLQPIREKYLALRADPAHLVGVLRDGSARAKELAEKKMGAVREVLGIRL